MTDRELDELEAALLSVDIPDGCHLDDLLATPATNARGTALWVDMARSGLPAGHSLSI